MYTFTLSWLVISTPLFCSVSLPLFSAEVGMSTTVTAFAAKEKLVLHPPFGMLMVPVVLTVEVIWILRLCAAKPFCMNPAQKRVPRVGSCWADWPAWTPTRALRTAMSSWR